MGEYIIIFLFLNWLLFTCFLSLMLLEKQYIKIPNRLIGVLCFSVVTVALILDTLFNLVVGTILFLQIPKEFLFTNRLERNIARVDWRGKIANLICTNLVDPFDLDGFHCCRTGRSDLSKLRKALFEKGENYE